MNDARTVTDSSGSKEGTGEPWYQTSIAGLAREIARLEKIEARGELAALRRVDSARPIEPSLFRLIARAAPNDLGATPDRVRRYGAVAKFMTLKPAALQRWGLGTALHSVGYSEHRLLALLNARGSTLNDLVRRAARRLASASEVAALPYMELATLVLLDGMVNYEPTLERVRLRIAADYQRAEYQISSSGET